MLRESHADLCLGLEQGVFHPDFYIATFLSPEPLPEGKP